MTTVIQMTSGLSFCEIRNIMQHAIGDNFGYDLRCQGTNGPAVHAELEVLGLEDKDQEQLSRLFVRSVKPIVDKYFGKFEVVTK